MSAPIFDETADEHPEIAINVHEDVEQIVDFQLGTVVREIVTRHELEFNYMEPLPAMKPLSTRKPWE